MAKQSTAHLSPLERARLRLEKLEAAEAAKAEAAKEKTLAKIQKSWVSAHKSLDVGERAFIKAQARIDEATATIDQLRKDAADAGVELTTPDLTAEAEKPVE